MATRLEAAKKILLYWMDGSIALVAVIYGAATIAQAMGGTISAPRAAAIIVLLLAYLALFPILMRRAFDYRPGPTLLLVIAGLPAIGLILLMPHSVDPSAVWVLWLALAALHLRAWTTF